MEALRIQKWLSQMGVASRREAESWITDGRIAINGKVVTQLGAKLDPDVDRLTIDGKAVRSKLPPRVYWLLHKPDEVLTTRVDGFQRRTIYDLPMLKKAPFLVSPVGRLDFRTEGLLLLTNDGELANRLCHPSYEVPRTYHVLITGRLSETEEAAMRNGMKLDDGPTGKADLRFAHGKNLGASRGSWYAITVREGRNRLVRRMFEHLGHRVVRLIRISYGGVKLPEDLAAGAYLQLSTSQIKALRLSVGLGSGRSGEPGDDAEGEAKPRVKKEPHPHRRARRGNEEA